jgi:hypothetical protein
MSKSEAVVLFDLSGVSSIPVGIKDLPDVDEQEYQRIINSFSTKRMIDFECNIFRPDKGLEKFLLPIVRAKNIMLLNYGAGNKCTFNVSLYFAENCLVAALDNEDESIMFLTIESVDDLLVFIPDVTAVQTPLPENAEPYVSYVLLTDNGSSIVHCTSIDIERGIAMIVEGQRTLDDLPIEVKTEVEILEYREMLLNKIKEVYDASGC